MEHVAKGDALLGWHEARLADQPVGGVGRLVLVLLFDQDAKDVREVLVQGAGLTLVLQVAVVVGDAVLRASVRSAHQAVRCNEREVGTYRKLMPDNISALAKLPKVTPSPSPYTICSQPSFLLTCHTALAYLLLKCTELLTLALRPSTEAYPNTSQKKFRTTRVLSWTSLTAVSLTAALPSG